MIFIPNSKKSSSTYRKALAKAIKNKIGSAEIVFIIPYYKEFYNAPHVLKRCLPGVTSIS